MLRRRMGQWQYNSPILDLGIRLNGQHHAPGALPKETAQYTPWIEG
jgi:hypothetical protein